MKTFLKTLLAAALLAGTGSAALAAGQTVKVGVAAEPYPPFTVPDASGKWSGWEIDIMDAICKHADLNCVVTPVAWDGIIPALTSKRIDMIMSSMSITPEREKSIDFSNKYYNTPSAIVGQKNEKIEPTDKSLKGKELGVQVSTTHERYAKKHFPDADIKIYQTQDEANQDLVSGRLDAVQADSLTMDAFLKSPEGKQCCEMKGMAPDDPEVLGRGVGVGMRKGDDQLKKKVNDAIATIRKDGEWDAITKKYFGDVDIWGPKA